MESTLKLVQSAVPCLADYMVDYTNQYCRIVTFAVESYVWLSTDHLKLPTNLSHKLTSCYISLFKVIE